MKPRLFHWAVLFSIIAAVLLLDQASKALVVARLAPGQTLTPLPALSDFFRIVHSQNTGAAFGLLPEFGGAFAIIAVIVSVGMLIAHAQMPAAAWGKRIAIALIISGALGNVIDRLRFDYVIDFINYRIPGVISNVSNLADHAIVGGVIVLLILTWRSDETGAKDAAPETSRAPEAE